MKLKAVFLFVVTLAFTLTPLAQVAADGNSIYLPIVTINFTACSDIPTLLSPANGSTSVTRAPLITWENITLATPNQFFMDVATDPGFTHVVAGLRNSPNTGDFRFPWNLDPGTLYYWRGWFKCNLSQNPYTSTFTFTTASSGTLLAAPTLTSPANGSNTQSTTVNLHWSPVTGATGYMVSYDDQTHYKYLNVQDNQAAISSLSPGTTYEWSVMTLNDYGLGPESAYWTFTTPADNSPLPYGGTAHSFVFLDNDGNLFTLIPVQGR